MVCEVISKPSAHLVGSRVPRDRGHAGRVPLQDRSVFKQVEQERQERPEAKHAFIPCLSLLFLLFSMLKNKSTALFRKGGKVEEWKGGKVEWWKGGA